jgi:hypothetical protein
VQEAALVERFATRSDPRLPRPAWALVTRQTQLERLQAEWNRDGMMGFAALYPSYRNERAATRGMGRAQRNPSSQMTTRVSSQSENALGVAGTSNPQCRSYDWQIDSGLAAGGDPIAAAFDRAEQENGTEHPIAQRVAIGILLGFVRFRIEAGGGLLRIFKMTHRPVRPSLDQDARPVGNRSGPRSRGPGDAPCRPSIRSYRRLAISCR